MTYRIITFCITIFIVSCSQNDPRKAIPGKLYLTKTDPIDIYYATKEKHTVTASYNWSICNEEPAKKKGFLIKEFSEKRTNDVMRSSLRLAGADIQNSNYFYTPQTNKEVEITATEMLSKYGICVSEVSVFPHNKTLKPGTPKSGAP